MVLFIVITIAYGGTFVLIDANAGAGSLRHAIQNENRTRVLCNYTGDIADAVTAFREGRPPAFR